MKKNLVLGIEFYLDDGWYGDRRRFIFDGEDGEGFRTKGEAGQYSSMLKKWCKARDSKYTQGKVDAKPLEDFPTYKYMGAGPSYSCKNINVPADEFLAFIEKEEAAMAKRKKERESAAKYRQTRLQRSVSMRRAKINRNGSAY